MACPRRRCLAPLRPGGCRGRRCVGERPAEGLAFLGQLVAGVGAGLAVPEGGFEAAGGLAQGVGAEVGGGAVQGVGEPLGVPCLPSARAASMPARVLAWLPMKRARRRR